MEIRVLPNAVALDLTAATLMLNIARQAVIERGSCSIALSGGSTPESLYTFIAGEPWRTNFPWDRMHFFWSDERMVPPDHADSNYRMALDAMLSKVPVLPKNVHRVKGESADPKTAACEYSAELNSSFHLAGKELPRFDLVLLGLGNDGHTASLFPATAALQEQQLLVAANEVPQLSTWRITMTYPVLNNAANIFFLVRGAEKAPILKDVLQGDETQRYPAQLIQPVAGRLLWMLDRQAAALLY